MPDIGSLNKRPMPRSVVLLVSAPMLMAGALFVDDFTFWFALGWATFLAGMIVATIEDK